VKEASSIVAQDAQQAATSDQFGHDTIRIDVARVIELAKKHRESRQATAEFLRLWQDEQSEKTRFKSILRARWAD
jgi:hypothetical protein